MKEIEKTMGSQNLEDTAAFVKDCANKLLDKIDGNKAGIIVLVASGVAGLATGIYYLVKEGLKAMSGQSQKAA